LNILMAALCLGAAYSLYSGKYLVRGLSISIRLLALLHLLNIVISMLFAARIGTSLLFPLALLSALIPTNTAFTSLIPGYFTIVLLPVLSLVLALPGGREEKAVDQAR
jgi:hypothetical protein